MPWHAIEGVPVFLPGRGWVVIGGRYPMGSEPGTVDGYLKQFLPRATAGRVAVVLEQAGVVTLDRQRPARLRLNSGW